MKLKFKLLYLKHVWTHITEIIMITSMYRAGLRQEWVVVDKPNLGTFFYFFIHLSNVLSFFTFDALFPYIL